MALKQNTTSICTAAESHITSYITTLTFLLYITSVIRANKLSTYYLPPITGFVSGTTTQISDPAPLIAAPLERLRLRGAVPEVRGYRVEPVGEHSAIVWLFVVVEGVEISNVYFGGRRMGLLGLKGGFLMARRGR